VVTPHTMKHYILKKTFFLLVNIRAIILQNLLLSKDFAYKST